MECSTCKKDVANYYRSFKSGAAYCVRCWNTVVTCCTKDGSQNAPGAAFCSDLTMTSDNIDRANLNKCESCGCWSSKQFGAIVANKWTCAVCLADDKSEEATVVDCFENVHLRLKVRGSTKAVEFFEYVMGEIDKDWPKRNSPICPKCKGGMWKMCAMNPNQLRKIAEVCGLGKLKIKYWGKEEKCA